MLALAGGTLVYTGCTDYSADIDGLKDRVTKLENSSATLAGVSAQIESLQKLTSDLSTASSNANTAIAALQAGSASAADVAALSGKVSSLESAKSTIESAIETLKSGKADAQTVANLVTSLSGVTNDVATIKGQSSTFQSQIDKLEAAIETLKSGKADVTALDANVKTLNDQIEALNTAIKALDEKAGISDITALENSIKEINTTIAGIKTQIAALDSSKADVTVVNTISETVEGIKTTVAAINTRIDGIEERVAAAEKKIAEITETISSKLDVNTAAATYATKIVVEAVTEDVSALETSLKALDEKYDGKIADLDAAVKAAQAAADAAQATADKALTKESFKDILGVYAEKGALAAKIEALVGADSDNAAAIAENAATIEANYQAYTEFVDEFGSKVNALIDAALGADGKFSYAELEEDIKALNAQVTAIKSDIEELKETVKSLTGRVNTAEEQIKSLNALTENLRALIKALEADKADADDVDADIKDLNKLIAEIQETVAGNKTWAEQTFATIDALKEVSEELGALEEKHGEDIETVKKLIAAAQETANKALTTESLKDILGAYADKGALEAKIKELEEADSTNADNLAKHIKNYDQLVEDFDGKVKTLINEALANEGQYTFAGLVKTITSLRTSVASIEGEIDAIWAAFDTEIRSLELLSDKEYMGKGVVEYEYFTSKAFVEKEETGDKTTNGYTFPANAGWSYKAAEGSVVPKWPTVKVNYRVNPSSVNFSKNSQFNFLMRNVTELATTSENAEDLYAGTANFDSYRDGILTVGLKLNNDTTGVKNSNLKNGEIIRFNLQAIRNNTSTDETSTVTSDAGVLIIKKEDDKTPELYFGKEASAKLYSSVEESNLLSVNLSTVDYSQTINLADSVTTKINGMAYDFKTNAYDFHYRFALVNYGKTPASGTIDYESNYVKSLNDTTGVLTPVNSMKSFNRKPLVKVTLNDANNNVLAYGFLPVLIDNSAKHISDTLAVAMTTTGNHTMTYTGKVAVGESIYEAVEEANAADFLAKYVLYKGGTDSNVIYVKNGDSFEAITKIGTLGVSGTFAVAGTETLTVSSSAANLAKIYAQPDHKFTVYVRYVLAADVDKTADLRDNDVLYVPIEITVDTNLSATVGTKISNLWFGEKQDSAYFNVKTPNTGGVLNNNWVTDLNSFWMGNKLQFVVSDGSEVSQYKFYFAPEQPKVNGIQLVVASKTINYLDGWTAEASTTVTKNADIIANELFAQYDAEGSIYANNALYAGSVSADNLVATINQSNGNVTFASTDVAKKLLNSSASLPVEDVELYANIGIVARRAVNGIVVSLGQSTVDKYFFPRPINASNDASAATFEDSDDKSVVSLYDAVDVTDWREATGSFKTADKAWYFAYYGFNKVKISGNVETDLGGTKAELVKVTSKISLKHELKGADKTSTGVTISWNAGAGSDSDISLPLGDTANAETLAAIKAAFGNLVYTNSGYYIKEPFKLYVPIEMTYVWGTFTFEVEITVNPTK